MTPDVVGDIAFFTCRRADCGAPLTMTRESPNPVDVQLACEHGHRFTVSATDDGGLTIALLGAGDGI
jgi:hypothetical protein